MKKENGFTLVELLAVIVILAVIAVIATPIIIGIINNAKIEAYKRQIEALEKAAEYYSIKHNSTITNTYVSVKTLNDEGFISNIINPITGKEYETGMNVNISIDEEGKVNYEVYEGPELVSGLIPVYYDENAMVWKKADKSNASNNWYDYNNFKWANVVIVTSTNRTTYMNASVGSTIPMSDINTMFVWIPRFRYKQIIDENNLFSIADVNFENQYTSKATGDSIEDYITDPAFTFGDEELNGIWIGKFETTGSISALIIKPDSKSLASLNIRSMFDGVKNTIQSNTTTYGFAADSDIHMSKSTEWNIIDILANSKYGKLTNGNYTGNKKVIYKNNSSSYYTGRSMGNTQSYGILTPTNDYSTAGYYTYDGKCAMIHTNLPAPCNSCSVGQLLANKNLAYGSSTTGTIYGIYDFYGGALEYSMGYYNGNLSNAYDNSGYSTTFAPADLVNLTLDRKYYNLTKDDNLFSNNCRSLYNYAGGTTCGYEINGKVYFYQWECGYEHFSVSKSPELGHYTYSCSGGAESWTSFRMILSANN